MTVEDCRHCYKCQSRSKLTVSVARLMLSCTCFTAAMSFCLSFSFSLGHCHAFPVSYSIHRSTALLAKKFTINENLVGSINSDGVFEGRETVKRPQSTKLGQPSVPSGGVASNKKNNDTNKPTTTKERQRTANGMMDSTLSTRMAAPEQERSIQVLEAKRGSKVVTIVR